MVERTDDEEIPRALLDAWPAAEPPSGFADRTVDAWRSAAHPAPRRSRAGALLGATFVAAAAVVLFFARGASAPSSGELSAARRETVHVGGRGVAVAEAGSALNWSVARDGSARVHQMRGSVFYRVERGGPFVVETDGGLVEVKGTCFQVEVRAMKRSSLASAAAGAAVATVALVTVYEGKVLLANEHGARALVAGERGEMARNDAPRAPSTSTSTDTSASTRASTNDEGWIAQQSELEKLRARVKELEAQTNESEKNEAQRRENDNSSFFAPSKDEIQQMAKVCSLKWDEPPINRPDSYDATKAAELGLDEPERQAVNRVNADFNARELDKIRAFYIEATGEGQGAKELKAQTMLAIIDGVVEQDDATLKAAFRQLSGERAGTVPATPDPSSSSLAERYYRFRTSLGDAYERELGSAIGPDLARQMRERKGAWGMRHRMSPGCPE